MNSRHRYSATGELFTWLQKDRTIDDLQIGRGTGYDGWSDLVRLGLIEKAERTIYLRRAEADLFSNEAGTLEEGMALYPAPAQNGSSATTNFPPKENAPIRSKKRLCAKI